MCAWEDRAPAEERSIMKVGIERVEEREAVERRCDEVRRMDVVVS